MNRALARLGRRWVHGWMLGVVLLCSPGAFAEPQGAPELSLRADASPAETLSLERAVALALSQGFAARIARLEAARAGDSAQESRGRYLPRLQLDSQPGYTNRLNETFTADGKEYGLDNLGNEPWLDVYLDQVLLDVALLREMERDRLAEEVAGIAEQDAREVVAYEVTRQYAELVRLESLVAASDERVSEASWLTEETRHLADSGRVLAVDIEEVDIYLASAAQRYRALKVEVALARAVLRRSLGSPGAAEHWPQVDAASLPDPTHAMQETGERMEALLRDAPQLQMLELQTRMEEASVGVAKAARLPTLQLRGGWSHYGIKRFDNFDNEAYVFVGIQLPIFDGLQAKNAIRGARKAKQVAELRYRSLLAEKLAGAERAAHQVGSLGSQLALAERRADSSRTRQRLADRALKAQRGPVLSALAAREQTLASVEKEISLRHRRLEVWASLQRELGRLVSLIAEQPARPAN